ncbi:MAG: PDZ domain-containing protein [Gammaproteobacteria bacterium]|nr:MAG: PDZ domain-containing protein [Gammaproteobacteria bacterium]
MIQSAVNVRKITNYCIIRFLHSRINTLNSRPDPFLQRLRWLIVSLLVILIVLQLLPVFERFLISLTAEPRTVTARGKLAADESNTIDIFNQASPSVVFITTKKRVVDLWTRNIRNVERGTGSGFVWDEHGHIVTNHHVIEEASEAKVTLDDGRSYNAILVGASPTHDLAVLKINIPINQPPPVTIGTSDDLRVGQKVFAIGNPFGLDHTLTTGVVSALNRSLSTEDGEVIEGLIQTDAAINPGNSGGPLLDSASRIIGINTAIYSPSGAYAGIGFAVPVDTVNRVVPQLIAKGRYVRPSIGISADDDINRIITEQLSIEGVLVLRVHPGSGAEVAGLRETLRDRNGDIIPGDIIMKINGNSVKTVSDLLSKLDDHHIGDKVTLTIWRNGKKLEVDVILQSG